MGLHGSLVGKVEIKSDADLFHDLFSNKPHETSEIAPGHIQGVDLHEGEWGAVGSIMVWNYAHEGKQKIAKASAEAIDEENKSVVFRVFEGDLMELYKNFTITIHVDTKGEDNVVKWTFEFEKLNDNVEDPTSLMDFCLDFSKHIEDHHLNSSSELPNEIGLHGKLVRQIEIQSDADLFHDLFRYKPHEISEITPTHIQGVDLHEGEWGTVGSIVVWNYTHEGKQKIARVVVGAIDEENKSVTFKVFEGDLMKLYKDFTATVHVDTKGVNNVVKWTFEYKKLTENVEDPITLMDFCLEFSKHIEDHHLN